MILGLDLHAWVAMLLTVAIFSTLVATRLPTDIAFLGGIVLMLFTGVVDIPTALSGFSDRTVVTVGALFIVVAGLESSGFLTWVVRHLLGVPRNRTNAMIRFMVPVAFLSSFMNNVTVASLFIGVIRKWSKVLNVPSSMLLIPLSYAASLGGTLLLIGSSANLMAASCYASATGKSLSIFAPLLPGLVTVLVGTVSTILLSRFLPVRRTVGDEEAGVLVELRVERGSNLVGMSVADAGLPVEAGDVRLACIVSYDGEIVHHPAPETVLIPGDTLALTGDRRQIGLLARRLGLKLPPDLEETDGSAVKTVLAGLIMVAMVALSALNVLPLLHCTLGAASLMIICRCCSLDSARKAFNLPLLMVYAGSIVLGKAIDQSGLSARAAHGFISMCGGASPVVLMAVFAAMTTIVTEFISNTACAAVMTPLAIQVATGLGVSPLPFVISVMLSCLASFATPTGTPTNLLVYGPGGYRFADFFRLGIPLNVIVLVTNVLVVPLFYPFCAD